MITTTLSKFSRFALTPKSQAGLIIFTSLFVLLSANMTLFRETFRVYSDQGSGFWFTVAVAIALYSVMLLILTVLTNKYTFRALLSLIITIAAVSAYFTDTFGVVIDNVMIQNLFETDQAETRDLLSLDLFVRIILLAVIPIAYLWAVPIKQVTIAKSLIHKGLTCLVAIIMLLGVISLNGNRFASYIRDQKILRFYATPIYPIYSFIYFVDDQLFPETPAAFVSILPDAKRLNVSDRPRLTIVVVGETARADRFQLNGWYCQINSAGRLQSAKGQLRNRPFPF